MKEQDRRLSESCAETYPFDQLIGLIRSWACPDEFRDRDLLETRYNLSTYLDAITRKKGLAGESFAQQINNESVWISRHFMPHIYDVAETVLKNLGFDFGEIADIEVRLLPAVSYNAYVNRVPTDGGFVFSFILSRAYLSGYADEEIEYLWGIRLYETLFDTMRYAYLDKQDEEGNPECLLPKCAMLVRKRMYFESLISMDRIGLVACGSLEAAQTCLIKDRHCGELGDRWLSIPSDDELEKLAQVYNLNAHFRMSEVDFFPIRLRCLRRFWSVFLANPSDETKARVDSEVTRLFEHFMPSPETAEDEQVMNLVASVGLDIVTQKDKVKDSAIRILLDELLEYVEPPSQAICPDSQVNATRKRKAIKFLKENDMSDGTLDKLLQSFARLAINSGERFDENNKKLVRLLKRLGIDDAYALLLLTSAYQEVQEVDADPLMDDLVSCARARLTGQPEPVNRRCRSRPLEWSKLPLSERIRYSADREDVDTLGNVYHLTAMIRQRETCQEKLASSDLPQLFFANLHLTPEVSPRVCRIVERVRETLGHDAPLEVFCDRPGHGPNEPDIPINACATIDVAKDGRHDVVNIRPETIEALDDDELAYVIGHEIGHLIYKHNQWSFVETFKECQKSMLPFMGDRLYWAWQQKCEISADRAGAVAAGSAEAALRAQLKVCYGLSARNLNANADVLLSQLKVVQDAEDMEWSSDHMKNMEHPIDPLRINALKAFCDVYYAKGVGASGLTPKHLDQVDERIARSYELLRRYPRTAARKAAMQIVALYGLVIISSDGIIEDRELAELLKLLMRLHTDCPIDELIGNARKRDKAIAAAVEVVANEGDVELKRTTMTQLAYLALVDGVLSGEDRNLLCSVAESLGLDAFDVDSTLQTAAEMSNFPVDFLLEDEIKTVRKMLEEAREVGGTVKG